jgi:hypothetical protein
MQVSTVVRCLEDEKALTMNEQTADREERSVTLWTASDVFWWWSIPGVPRG